MGRYINEFDNIKAMYNDGKILIYSDEFIQGQGIKIVDVKDLYDIFDSSIDSSHLQDKEKSTVRKDIEKKNRHSNSL